MRLSSSKRRAGFTLTELVVVISIILVLAGILIPAAMSVRGAAARTATRTEIEELDGAMKNQFFAKYNFYPPSQLHVCALQSSYTNSQLDVDSKNCITRMFPRITWTTSMAWGQPDGVLQGDQVLVWALGGVQSSAGGVNSCLGFSNNPRNPTDSTAGFAGPFYNFRPGRLVNLHGNGWFSYLDYYKVPNNSKPYLYFSAFGGANQYNRYVNSDCSGPGAGWAVHGGPTTMTPWPYQQTAGQFINPNSFQIISAGKDGNFGPGTVPSAGPYLTPGSGSAVGVNGDDDLANFSRGALGGY